MTNHHNAPGNKSCNHASRLLSEDDEVIGCGSSRNERLEGDQTKAVHPALIEVLLAVPDGSDVELLSTLNHVVEELSRTAAQRKATCYLKKDGKTLLEDHAALVRIDEILEAKNLRLSARRPSTYQERSHAKTLLDEIREFPPTTPFGRAA
ncbi:hypothetical protein [Rhizobium leguminosarum]|uniref:hypothetical protein n=1 Tax=Rhizobium leguminosarum TaxID=384 RepID=UPI00103091B6|nr:hypothetical protein [Rhizobium leguminosarum]TBF42880.1 hypothetical protein ELG92_23690 [Rhizobium leguminosarum]